MGKDEIRHSMDEAEFKKLVAGEIVDLAIDERVFPNAPRIRIALKDIGWDRIIAAVDNAMEE